MEDDWTDNPYKMLADLSVHEFYTPQHLRLESSFFCLLHKNIENTSPKEKHIIIQKQIFKGSVLNQISIFFLRLPLVQG